MQFGDDRRLPWGVACIAWTLVAWSSVPLFLRHFAGYLDAWTANGWRYGVSALLWAPLLLWRGSRGTLPAGILRAALVPAIVNTVGQCCFAWVPYYIQPGLMTFMVRLQIIFIALGAYLLFPSERLLIRTKRYWLGVVVVLGGSAGTAFFSAAPKTGATMFGIVLAITAGMLFGAYVLGVRYYLSRYSPILSFAVICQYTAAGLISLMFLLGEQRGIRAWEMSWPQFVLLLVAGLIGIGLSHASYYAAMARLSVGVASAVILLQPFLTSAGSVVLFAEELTPLQWTFGTIAMLGALFLIVLRQRLESAERRERPLAVAPETAAITVEGP